MNRRSFLAFCLLPGPGAVAGPATPAWDIEVVDPGGTGRFSSLKFDSSGNGHLAYVLEDGAYSLKYGFWDRTAKRWFLMTVSDQASFSALALDSKQRPHIVWADFGTVTGCKLHHAFWDESKWNRQTLPLNADTVAYYTAITFNAQDDPTISYYEYDGPRGTGFRVRMRTVIWNGSNWELRTADGDNQSGKFNDLATDLVSGKTHLLYANVNALTAGVRLPSAPATDRGK